MLKLPFQDEWRCALRVVVRTVRNTIHRWFTGRTFAQKHLERAFQEKPDPWQFGTSSADVERFRKTLELLPAISYRHILEVGCAEGYFTEQIARRFPTTDVLAVDFVPPALERAKRRCGGYPNVRFEYVDVGREQVDGVFDLILCMGVLEYGPTLRELNVIRDRLLHALHPGGYLLLETHLIPEELQRRWWVNRLAWGARALHHRFITADMVVITEAVVCENRLSSLLQKSWCGPTVA